MSKEDGFIPLTWKKKPSRAARSAAGKGSAEGHGSAKSSGQKPPSEGPPLKPETSGTSGAGPVRDAARSAESEAWAETRHLELNEKVTIPFFLEPLLFFKRN